MHNKSMATQFLFLGFPGLGEFKTLLFISILSAYATTVLLDMVIIVLVSSRKSLHSPMYFFLTNFFISEMFLVTTIVPNMLCVIWLDGAFISIPGCITQSYLFIASGSSECFLLAAMSYDRCLAICKPLHYNTTMGPRLQNFLVFLCWMFGFQSTAITLGLLVDLKFCDQYIIDHYFCDLAPIVNLACSKTFVLQLVIFVLSFLIIVIPFILVIVSYVSIFVVILRMTSVIRRKKAFSTCSTHLSVVGMFYGTLMINYFIPARGELVVINKMLSIIVIVVTPLFNPIIYCLRNKDMRAAINNCILLQQRELRHK